MAKQDDKLFTVAGTATNPDGTTKVRFANDLVARVKILTKAGCTNIELVELPQPMTKYLSFNCCGKGKMVPDLISKGIPRGFFTPWQSLRPRVAE